MDDADCDDCDGFADASRGRMSDVAWFESDARSDDEKKEKYGAVQALVRTGLRAKRWQSTYMTKKHPHCTIS